MTVEADAPEGDANFKIEECTVACVGFSGSAQEYVSATGGSTADRVP